MFYEDMEPSELIRFIRVDRYFASYAAHIQSSKGFDFLLEGRLVLYSLGPLKACISRDCSYFKPRRIRKLLKRLSVGFWYQ